MGLVALAMEDQSGTTSGHGTSELFMYPEHSQRAPGPQFANEAAQYENNGRLGQWTQSPMSEAPFFNPGGGPRFSDACIDPRLR